MSTNPLRSDILLARRGIALPELVFVVFAAAPFVVVMMVAGRVTGCGDSGGRPRGAFGHLIL